MTQIPDTTTEEGRQAASVLLAQLVGWITTDEVFHHYHPPSGGGTSVNHRRGQVIGNIFGLVPTLYNPANMALAWRVLNWAFSNLPGKTGQSQEFWDFLHAQEYWDQHYLWGTPPAEAQRAWLDKILTLAIQAKMFEEVL